MQDVREEGGGTERGEGQDGGRGEKVGMGQVRYSEGKPGRRWRGGGGGGRWEGGEQDSSYDGRQAGTCLVCKLDVAEVVRNVLLEGAVRALNIHKDLQGAALGSPASNAAFQGSAVHLPPPPHKHVSKARVDPESGSRFVRVEARAQGGGGGWVGDVTSGSL